MASPPSLVPPLLAPQQGTRSPGLSGTGRRSQGTVPGLRSQTRVFVTSFGLCKNNHFSRLAITGRLILATQLCSRAPRLWALGHRSWHCLAQPAVPSSQPRQQPALASWHPGPMPRLCPRQTRGKDPAAGTAACPRAARDWTFGQRSEKSFLRFSRGCFCS